MVAGQMADKLKVFISYSRVDAKFANELVAGLEFDGGFDITIDRHSIEQGDDDWQARLRVLIEAADTIVFVLSPTSAESKMCRWEVAYAAEFKKRILPVLHVPLGAVEPPPGLSQPNYVDFTTAPTLIAGIRELATSLRKNFAWLREGTRLLNLALDWERSGKRDNRLLSGPDIEEAKQWRDKCPKSEQPTELHRDYIRASEAAEVSRLDAERNRLAQLAAAQEKAAARTRVGLAVAVVLGGAAAWFGWDANRKAERAAEAVRVVEMLQVQQLEKGVMPRELRDRQSFKRLEVAAEKGNVTAMWVVGELTSEGRGTTKDFSKALDWFRKAALMGDAFSMNQVGWYLTNGLGAAIDHREAFVWFEKAVGAGNSNAINNIGWMHDFGRGIAKDHYKARQWYDRAVSAGNPMAMNNIGWQYDQGWGVDKNLTTAQEWFEKSAAAGEGIAMRNLGWAYANAEGVPRDLEKARAWYENGAAAGDARSMELLGGMYQNGMGVTQDYAAALKWYKFAYEAGELRVASAIGNMYEQGVGVTVNHETARDWYEKGAKHFVDAYINRLLDVLSGCSTGSDRSECGLILMAEHLPS
jgi:TPR repeat protein